MGVQGAPPPPRRNNWLSGWNEVPHDGGTLPRRKLVCRFTKYRDVRLPWVPLQAPAKAYIGVLPLLIQALI